MLAGRARVPEADLDQRIKELEAQLKEQELRDKRSSRPLFAQSYLAALPIVLTVGLGFVGNYFVLAKQGDLEREKQSSIAAAAEKTRTDEANRTFTLQEKEAANQLMRQEREFTANAKAAASRFEQEQLTLRSQHVAQQAQQAREFGQSFERQRREAEVELILKASEVPTSLSPEQQDVQRARNLLWFADAGYIRIPRNMQAKLQSVGRLQGGQAAALPVVHAAGGTAGVDLAARFAGFNPKATSDPGGSGRSWIGYGHDLTEEERRTNLVKIGSRLVDMSHGLNEEQSRTLLRQDMAPHYKDVDDLVKVHLTPSQRDALAVFVFNAGSLKNKNLLKRLNGGEYHAVPDEMRR